MTAKTISAEQFRDGARDAVLKALDEYVRDLTECSKSMGARDEDLPALFAGIDAHMSRVAERFNAPDSSEPGSEFIKIVA